MRLVSLSYHSACFPYTYTYCLSAVPTSRVKEIISKGKRAACVAEKFVAKEAYKILAGKLERMGSRVRTRRSVAACMKRDL
jgi:hypothetical protein